MRSFALLRTNVGLTTNVKIMVDSNYRLSLESIDSNQNLSSDRYKNMGFSTTNFYDELVPYFFKDTPSETAFSIKYDGDVDTMIDTFQHQYDEIYQYGARNIINNKNYQEEYEYFAPLYIKRNKLPKKFVIFRIDGAGVEILTKDTFKSRILNRLKAVKVFDMTNITPLGEWLDRNFVKNDYFPETPLEMDFRNLEFCKWNGIDYETGGYTTKSLFIDDVLDEEKEIFELEKFIFDNYKNNKVVFPNILNFSFLFDDTPATPDATKKWTLNRYLGFYVNEMEEISSLSPYQPPALVNDVTITQGNFLTSETKEDPFEQGYKFSMPYYVEYLGNYYKVEIVKESLGIQLQQVNNEGFTSEEYIEVFRNKYKIICDIDLTGKESLLNNNVGYINSENKLIKYDGSFIEIENFSDADVWLIEIDGIFHNLVQDNNSVKLNTDYSFSFFENTYEYKVAGNTKIINFITDFVNEPKKFKIYRLNFTDIKDFDDRIVDTEFSKFEYEKVDDLTLTDETKMYFENINSLSNPKDLDDFKFKNEVVNIPVSSEYTANFETFKIENGELTELWRKNPVHTRWSYQNSLSANDYPYLLNNSQIFEDFNRTTNPFDPEPKRIERNLDYFYTINSSTSSYLHHTLHVEKIDSGIIDTSYRFDTDKYLNISTYSTGTNSYATYSFDYFTAFFERKADFLNSTIKKNVKKYSEFNIGDTSIPNLTLFRGIEYRIYDVDGISLDANNAIDTINLKTSNKFEDYKFSVLLSDNNKPFNETTCFDISISAQEVETKDFSLDTLIWSGSYFTTTNFEIYNYLGWYLKISDVLTEYYISNVQILGTTASPTNIAVTIAGTSGTSISNYKLSRVENRIDVDPTYIDRLKAGELIYIESDCYNGTFSIYEDSITNWNLNNTISLIGDESSSPIFFEFQVSSGLFQSLRAVESSIPFNGKSYYTLYDYNNLVEAYCIWSSAQERWEIYELFDGINATTIYAYSSDNLEYPVDSNWTLDTGSIYVTIYSEIRHLIFSATCSGTWCHHWESYNNEMDWTIIDEWKMDEEYKEGSIVVFEDILYQAITDIDIETAQRPVQLINLKQVKSAPYNVSEWTYFNPPNNTIFWSPIASYNLGDYVYNEGEYYYYATSSGHDFWNPDLATNTTGYNLGDVVLFKGEYYISMTSSNNYAPDYSKPWFSQTSQSNKFWSLTQSTNPNWIPIEIWNPSTTYVISGQKYIAHNDVLYVSVGSVTTIDSDEEPGISQYWIRQYSFIPDTNLIYNSDNNSVIIMNNRYYLINSNTTDSTLENGIVIYINKKWKNIFVNININDNTLPNINNSDRDVIYDDLYKKITAFNFIQSMNDISNKYGFTDYVKYVVIDENGSSNTYSYDNNISHLPYLITCEVPDLFEVKVRSLDIVQLESPADLKPIKRLRDGNVKLLNQLNHYNNVPIAYNIIENKFEPKVFENYHGNKNILKDELYRFTGYYMPLFYDIQLFEKDFEYKKVGNYKFDTSLSEFGIMKERRFRKVNRKGSVLKLRDAKDFKSIYPMLDEFGYSTEDFFIFRSTWDIQYHSETVPNDPKFIVNLSDIQLNAVPEDIGQPISSQDENLTL